MAKAELILQALANQQHASVINDILSMAGASRCLFSVAFVRTAGIASIENALKALAVRPTVYVGIRNDITSIQAIRRLLDIGVDLYIVDTGARRPIFHPKLYMVAGKARAKALIGSANLTHYGLQDNIELSTLLDLDLKRPEDAKFVESVFGSFANLATTHPSHVQHVTTLKHAEALFSEGRLCDEDFVLAPSTSQQAPKKGFVGLAPMNLFRGPHLRKPKAKGTLPNATVKAAAAKASILSSQFVRVWQSKPLVARDLSVPEGENTNLTGSIGFKQDAVKEFDFQTYFREEVFGELDWYPTTKQPLKEDATASFQLVLENLDYGSFSLKVAHDNRKDTRSYLQRNFVTQLHWGIARPIIARPDLVGRTLFLYKRGGTPPTYLIEID